MVDLNYMMYTSMTGDTRQINANEFFESYYANFATILAANNQTLQFTLPMLKEEFFAKNIYGLMLGTTLIPMILIESDDVPDMEDLREEEMEKAMEEQKEKIMDLVQVNPLLTSRFLSMFNEMKQQGLFDSMFL